MRRFTFALVAVIIVCAFSAALIINTAVPHIDEFLQVELITVEGEEELPGITFCHETGTLFAVSDKGALIEINSKGSVLRRIIVKGAEDIEGITFGLNSFTVVDEETGRVIRFKMPVSNTLDLATADAHVLLPDSDNDGLEGIGYSKVDAKWIVVKEKEPPEIYVLSFRPRPKFTIPFDNLTYPFEDLAGVAVHPNGNIVLLSEVGKKAYELNRDGEIISELAIEMNQPEGITFDDNGIMYIIGEPS